MIDTVVTYYNQNEKLDILYKRTQETEFETLTARRRALFWGEIYKLTNDVDASAVAALAAIDNGLAAARPSKLPPWQSYDEAREMPADWRPDSPPAA